MDQQKVRSWLRVAAVTIRSVSIAMWRGYWARVHPAIVRGVQACDRRLAVRMPNPLWRRSTMAGVTLALLIAIVMVGQAALSSSAATKRTDSSESKNATDPRWVPAWGGLLEAMRDIPLIPQEVQHATLWKGGGATADERFVVMVEGPNANDIRVCRIAIRGDTQSSQTRVWLADILVAAKYFTNTEVEGQRLGDAIGKAFEFDRATDLAGTDWRLNVTTMASEGKLDTKRQLGKAVFIEMSREATGDGRGRSPK